MRRAVALAFSLALLLTVPAGACTTFCYLDGTRVLFGRNYDFEHTEQNAARRHLDVGGVDFSCGPVRALAIDAGEGSVASAFAPHSIADNVALLRASFARTSFLSGVPAADVEQLARRPERTRCGLPQAA